MEKMYMKVYMELRISVTSIQLQQAPWQKVLQKKKTE